MFRTIRTRLLLGFLLCISIPGALGPIGYIYLKDRSALDASTNSLKKAQLELQRTYQFTRDFINFGQRDVEFFASGHSEHLVKRAESLRGSYESLAELRNSTDSAFEPIIDRIVANLGTYESNLTNLVQVLRQRGFQDFGVVGRMREAIHGLEEDVDSPDLMVHMLSLRRHEKDYIIRNQARYVDALRDRAVVFEQAIAMHRKFDKDERVSMTRRLQNYVATFEELVSVDETIGIRGGVGQFSELNDIEQSLVADFDELQTLFNDYALQKTSSLANFLLVSFAAVGVLSLLISLVLSRRLTSPLHTLSRKMQEYVESEFKDDADLEGLTHVGDEVGQIARDFGELQRAIKEHVSSIHKAEQKSRLLSSIIERSSKSLAFTDAEFCIHYANSAFTDHLKKLECRGSNIDLRSLFAAQGQTADDYEEMESTVKSGKQWSAELVLREEDDSRTEAIMVISPVHLADDALTNLLISYEDVSERNVMERMLHDARRLESVGQLAAGVAHEINTPIQFVGDNTRFLRDSCADIGTFLRELIELAGSDKPPIDSGVIAESLEELDAEYLIEETATAIDQSLEGISRVAKIVQAMKQFSHPSNDRSEVNVNQAIESTVTVASNEWKYVAEMDLDLAADMPYVYCDAGQFNQVLLNMIVNASHALADAGKGNAGGLGLISISSAHNDDWAEIRISDNGCGMPADVKARVFDPFFTTKDVGKGTGQGLSIAHDVVVNKHKGTITVESEPGEGTTFVIRLPLRAEADGCELAARTG